MNEWILILHLCHFFLASSLTLYIHHSFPPSLSSLTPTSLAPSIYPSPPPPPPTPPSPAPPLSPPSPPSILHSSKPLFQSSLLPTSRFLRVYCNYLLPR